MFIQPDISILAVLAGGIIVMIVGSLWYTPRTFFNTWAREQGKNPNDIKPNPAVFGYMFIGALIQSYVLANIVRAFGANSFVSGALLGALIWFGLIATTMIGNYQFAGRSWKLYGIDAGYYLVTFVLLSMLHSVWM
jgi:hypothetical protein